VRAALEGTPPEERAARAWAEAVRIMDDEIAVCEAIGGHGLALLRALPRRNETLQVLTHCNAGWLATGAWGTALAPVYKAHAAGLPVHGWVHETPPRAPGT